jgi:hypothetical protein
MGRRTRFAFPSPAFDSETCGAFKDKKPATASDIPKDQKRFWRVQSERTEREIGKGNSRIPDFAARRFRQSSEVRGDVHDGCKGFAS